MWCRLRSRCEIAHPEAWRANPVGFSETGSGVRQLSGVLTVLQPAMNAFLNKLKSLPAGYSEGGFNGRRYGTTRKTSADGSRTWLYAEALGGNDRISFNLYRLKNGEYRLKPCEMPERTVVKFILGYEPDQPETGK